MFDWRSSFSTQRRGVLPGEPEVQRQVVADAEVVLREDADAVLQVREGRHQAAAALRRHLIEQEVREGEAGEGAGVVEVAEDALVARVGEALPLIEPASAELAAGDGP